MDKTPNELADERLKLANDYGKLGERKVKLKYLFADYYKTFRPDHKSDAGLERAWELTDDGLELMMLKEKMRAKMYKMSAMKTKVDVANAEAFNQY